MAEREVRERRRHAQRERDCGQQDGRRPETGERAPATVEQEQGGEEDDELGLVEQAAQHHTGDAVAAAPQEHIHRGEDEQRQQAVLPIADGRPDGDEGQHPWRRADPIDEPERPHHHQDAECAPERECREVGQRGERHEEQREEGRVDQAVTPGPLAGQPVLDPLLQVGIVEVVRLVPRRRGLVDGCGHVIVGDLLTPRMAAKIVLDGRGAELYDFSLQMDYQRAALAPETIPGHPFIWPPWVALFYTPWAHVPQGPALVMWTACSLACLVTALLVMARAAPLTGRPWPSTLLLSLSFYPVLEGLMAGNNSLWSLPIFALMYRALRLGNDATAGALLGLQLYRPQLAVVPLVVFAAKRRWRILVGAATVGVVCVLLSVLCIGERTPLEWLAQGAKNQPPVFKAISASTPLT